MKAQILIMLLVLLPAVKLQAGTILVPEDYSTIQAGIKILLSFSQPARQAAGN